MISEQAKTFGKKSLKCFDYTISGSAALASAVCQDSVSKGWELSSRTGEMMAAPLFLMTCFLFPLFVEFKCVWVWFFLFVFWISSELFPARFHHRPYWTRSVDVYFQAPVTLSCNAANRNIPITNLIWSNMTHEKHQLSFLHYLCNIISCNF